jgi:membrane-bound ClpP family serine protease
MFRLPSHIWRRCGSALAVAAAVGLLAGWPVDLPVAWAADAGQPGADGPVEGQPQVERLGMLVRVELPVTDRTVRRVRGFVDRALTRARERQRVPVLIFEFRVGEEGEESAVAGEFIDALKLARTIAGEDLSSVRTVAYVPEELVGHAVLAAIACEDIVMPAEARLGPVGAKPEEQTGSTERSAYAEIARRRRTVPAPVALWLLDPSERVLKVETPVSREFVTEEGLEELRERQPIRSVEALRDMIEGQPGELTGSEARRLGLVSFLPSKRTDVALRALGLPPEAMQEDPTLVGEDRAVRIDLKGPVRSALVHQLQRQIQDEVRENEVNFICVWVDSAGGAPAESIQLARTLADLPSDVRTVAYVPSRARSDAALVALACDQLVMNPAAELGGSGNYELEPDDVQYVREAIEAPDGPWRQRSWSLVAALIDPGVEVFRCERLDEVGFFSDAERETLNEKLRRADPGAKLWEKGAEQITTPGKPLLIDGQRALEYGLASTTVESFAELKQHFGLEDDPTLLAPGWADFLVDALSSWAAGTVLLVIAFVALYIELSTPGIGIGGFAAAICFLLFFWANHLGGTAEWLEVLLFVAGIGCLLLEVFVIPGFGIFGLGGGVLVLASLVLASQTFVLPQNPYQVAELNRSLLALAGTGVGIAALVVVVRRWLPSTPAFRDVVLAPPEGEEAEVIERRESLLDLDESFVGTQGKTTTQLTPSGKARFGDMLLDVITDGDVVPRGATIEVVEIQGNRVLVRQVT